MLERLDNLEERIEVARRVLRTTDPEELLNEAYQADDFNINLLYGYLRSFVRLSYLGDVSAAAEDTGQTRQTIKKHILELESLLDCRLFERVGVRSELSERGVMWLPRAEEIYELANAFLTRRGLSMARYQTRQLPLRMLLHDAIASSHLRRFAQFWMVGEKSVSSDDFAEHKENCVIYERRNGGWASRCIGLRSAYSGWFGADVAKQNEGLSVADMATGAQLRDEISFLLDGVYTKGGLHFSEVSCVLPKAKGSSERYYILFQRVLAEMIDEYKRPVVASMIEIIDHQKVL